MRVTRTLAFMTTCALIGVACSDDTVGIPSNVEIYTATLNGQNEVPALPTPTTATGKATVTLVGNVISWTVEVQNINNVSLAHIHLGDASTPGSVRQDLSPTLGNQTALTVIANGSATPTSVRPVTDGFIDSLRAGNTYVNVHTNDGNPNTSSGPGDYPAGEIRGQLKKLQ